MDILPFFFCLVKAYGPDECGCNGPSTMLWTFQRRYTPFVDQMEDSSFQYEQYKNPNTLQR